MPTQATTNARPEPNVTPAGPCAMVIFGAGGDLTKRLVVPALYNLTTGKALPERFALIGVDNADLSTDQWRQRLTDMMQSFTSGGGEFQADSIDQNAWKSLVARMTYLRGDFGDNATFSRLADLLEEKERTDKTGGNVLFYLAVADRFFGSLAEKIAAAGLADQQGGKRWRRVIVEKPFGHDYDSAKALNARLLKILSEDQIFRIDHFLGKETVQSILAVRFANGIFEPIWNRDHIDHVQITAAETIGVEHRGRFYEQTGALRDMVPNHMFQLLTMTAMEPPSSFDPDAVRSRKNDILNAIPPVSLDCAVRGQYAAGTVLGQHVDGYRREPDVSPNSPVETYTALKLEIDTWRWAGVPFYLRTGKRMSNRWTEIAIHFRRAPLALFKGTDVAATGSNWLILHIQPHEGISLHFGAKVPGEAFRVQSVSMDFGYEQAIHDSGMDGYTRLLFDAMTGDPTLFIRTDEVEQAWRIVDPYLEAWAEPGGGLHFYAAGTWGPHIADLLLERSGDAWRDPEL